MANGFQADGQPARFDADVVEATVVEPEPPRGLAAVLLDREWRLRTFWRLSLYLVAMLAINCLVGIGAVVAAAVYEMIQQRPIDDATFSQLASDPTGVFMLVGALGVLILTLPITAVFRVYIDRRSVRSIGLGRPRRWGRVMVAGLLCGAVPALAGVLVIGSAGGYRAELEPRVSAAMWIWMVALVPSGIYEELVFRGYMLRNLLDIRRPVWGIFVTSLLFWLVHGMNPGAWSSPWIGANLFLAGVILGLLYAVAENLWLPTVAHVSWNLAQLMLGIPVSGLAGEGLVALEPLPDAPQWLTGGAFGYEGSAVCTVAELVVAGLLWIMWRGRRRADSLPPGFVEEHGGGG